MPLEALALLLDLVGLGAPLWWLTGQALSLLLWLARTAATAPGAVALLPAMAPAAFALMIAGGLWLCLWRTKLRRWGLLPLALGAVWALATPAPDLIVTGDGRHLALRTPDGGSPFAAPARRRLCPRHPGRGERRRARIPRARIAADRRLQPGSVRRRPGSRRPPLAHPRHAHPQPGAAGGDGAACAAADIVVSDRVLPRACTPRWLRADLAFLRRTGGLAITLGDPPAVTTVAEREGRHPWALPPEQPPAGPPAAVPAKPTGH
jgi:competence protein ComEC